jgi:uncharacterized protein YndB with AHSA1/START domain
MFKIVEMNSQFQEITLARTIHAPAMRVYTAFTSADGWCEWCCEKAEVDARIDGKLHIYTEGYNAYGKFTILEQDKVVAFTWDGDKEPPTRIHVGREEQGDNTLVTFKVIVLDPELTPADFAEFLERIWHIPWGRLCYNPSTLCELLQSPTIDQTTLS